MSEKPMTRTNEFTSRAHQGMGTARLATRYFASYVHRRRRPKSGIFDADLYRKFNLDDWELAAVFCAAGTLIEFDIALSDYKRSLVRVDGVQRTARQLLDSETATSGPFTRVWTRPPNLRTTRPYIDTGYCTVYENRRSGTLAFDRDAFGRHLLRDHDLLAVVKARGRRDLWFRFTRPNHELSVLEADDHAWTAEQLLNGEAEDSGLAKLVWERPK